MPSVLTLSGKQPSARCPFSVYATARRTVGSKLALKADAGALASMYAKSRVHLGGEVQKGLGGRWGRCCDLAGCSEDGGAEEENERERGREKRVAERQPNSRVTGKKNRAKHNAHSVVAGTGAGKRERRVLKRRRRTRQWTNDERRKKKSALLARALALLRAVGVRSVGREEERAVGGGEVAAGDHLLRKGRKGVARRRSCGKRRSAVRQKRGQKNGAREREGGHGGVGGGGGASGSERERERKRRKKRERKVLIGCGCGSEKAIALGMAQPKGRPLKAVKRKRHERRSSVADSQRARSMGERTSLSVSRGREGRGRHELLSLNSRLLASSRALHFSLVATGSELCTRMR